MGTIRASNLPGPGGGTHIIWTNDTGSNVAAYTAVQITPGLYGVTEAAIDNGDSGSLYLEGVFTGTNEGVTITTGEFAYVNSSNEFTNVAANGTFFGVFLEDSTASQAAVAKLTVQSLALPRGNLVQEDLAEYPIPLASGRVHDAYATNLPGTAANDDLGLVTGTFGTTSLTLNSVDFGGTTTTAYALFEVTLPPEYVAGQTATLSINAGMLTTVADTAATVDAEVYSDDGDGTVTGDLCATAAQSINSLTAANKSFTITPTTLSAGDKLFIRITVAGEDSGDAGVMKAAINKLSLLLDIKG